MDLEQQMNRIYRETPLESIPWNCPDPPALLADLVRKGWVAPCDAVDLGCGAGHYAAWLALQGFRVTGVDLSSRAVELAIQLAGMRGVGCRFLVADLRRPVVALDACFEFAYDWEVLHHVYPRDRGRYVANVHRMLRPGGRYLSVCFSVDDPAFGGAGKYRRTSIGTRLYFSSEAELRRLFRPLFDIEDLRTIEIEGKYGRHAAVQALMHRPG